MRSFKTQKPPPTAASYRIKTSHGLVIPAFPVHFYWEIEMQPDVPDALQHVLPAVYIDMIFPIQKWIGTDGYEGIRTEPFLSPILHTARKVVFGRNCRLFGIRFDPVYVTELYAGSPSALEQGANDFVSFVTKPLAHAMLEAVYGVNDFESRTHKINQVIREGCQLKADTRKSICTFALEYIRANPHSKVKDLSRLTGYSSRWIERLFKENMGSTPQDIIRVTRFNRFIARLQANNSSSLTSLAFECGYYDQSHLIHDFRRLSPHCPSEFQHDFPLLSRVMNHL
jgi:AraC-like DNA-binding protein